MYTAVHRSFTVDVPLETAWAHLAQVEQWPSWAQHITRVDLSPPGALTPGSTGVIHLKNAPKTAFHMTVLDYPRHWTWAGRLLWLTVHYDHRFEPVTDTRTRLTWQVDCDGVGAALFGRLFSAVYNRNLNAAIPTLVAEMNAQAGNTAAPRSA